jgi:hypothetical protein
MFNVENYPVFLQTLHLPSSGWMCSGWAFLEALYRAGSRWQVGCNGADWWSERAHFSTPPIRIGISGRVLWTWEWTFTYYKRQGISSPAQCTISFSRKTLLMKLVICKIKVLVEVWLFGNYCHSPHSEYTFGPSCTHFDAFILTCSRPASLEQF